MAKVYSSAQAIVELNNMQKNKTIQWREGDIGPSSGDEYTDGVAKALFQCASNGGSITIYSMDELAMMRAEHDKIGKAHTQAVPINQAYDPIKLTFTLPVEVAQYSHDIRRFVDAMIYKLRVHSRKGRWEDGTLHMAMEGLEGEISELKVAIALGNHVEIGLEAADVANYALIASSIATERGK